MTKIGRERHARQQARVEFLARHANEFDLANYPWGLDSRSEDYKRRHKRIVAAMKAAKVLAPTTCWYDVRLRHLVDAAQICLARQTNEAPLPADRQARQDVRQMILDNFIDWYTSDEDERNAMKTAARTYLDEDHADELFDWTLAEAEETI